MKQANDFRACMVPDGHPKFQGVAQVSCLDALLAEVATLIESWRIRSTDFVGAYEKQPSPQVELSNIALAQKLRGSQKLRWKTRAGDLVSLADREPSRVLGPGTGSCVEIDPGIEEDVENCCWIPDPEQILDRFEEYFPDYDGFFLGPAPNGFYSLQAARGGTSVGADPLQLGVDPQGATLRFLISFYNA